MSENISQAFIKIKNYFSSGPSVSNYLDTIISTSYNRVPYAAIGIIAVFLGAMTYVTVSDSVSNIIETAETTVSSISVPEIFTSTASTDESKQLAEEDKEASEREKQLESEIKEESEGSVKGGSRKRKTKQNRKTKRSRKVSRKV
jgi:hypothetical protein